MTFKLLNGGGMGLTILLVFLEVHSEAVYEMNGAHLKANRQYLKGARVLIAH